MGRSKTTPSSTSWFGLGHITVIGHQHREVVAELRQRRARGALSEGDAAKRAVSVGSAGELTASRPVVTVNEQYGAGAAYVAERVAERLGVPYVGSRFDSADLESA